jgi:hypothetical protein
MSGLREVSILAPERIGAREIVHIPINFQATSVPNRAHEIIACGGLLSIKAHIFKHGGGYTMADGLNNQYAAYLDDLLSDLERRYGDSLWWTSMSQAAARCEPRADASLSLRAA